MQVANMKNSHHIKEMQIKTMKLFLNIKIADI